MLFAEPRVQMQNDTFTGLSSVIRFIRCKELQIVMCEEIQRIGQGQKILTLLLKTFLIKLDE